MIYCLTEEVKGEKYQKFMEYALKKSDAFLLVYFFPREDEAMEAKMKRFHERLMPYRIKRRLDMYWLGSMSFESSKTVIDDYKAKGRLKVKDVRKDVEGIVGEQFISQDPTGRNCVEIYKSSMDVLPALCDPQSIYEWKGENGYPTDLSFYKKGLAWLVSEPHEAASAMYAPDQEDVEFIKSLNIKYVEKEEDLSYEKYRRSCHEEYTV